MKGNPIYKPMTMAKATIQFLVNQRVARRERVSGYRFSIEGVDCSYIFIDLIIKVDQLPAHRQKAHVDIGNLAYAIIRYFHSSVKGSIGAYPKDRSWLYYAHIREYAAFEF
jgi:hypothetical protein